jgi:hypothetical protein
VVNDFTQTLLMRRGKFVIVIALGRRHIPSQVYPETIPAYFINVNDISMMATWPRS